MGTYDTEAKSFYLNVKFDQSGTLYNVIDTLILCQDTELDLRYEEWNSY